MTRGGYFDGSCWANAEPVTAVRSVIHPRHRPRAAQIASPLHLRATSDRIARCAPGEGFCPLDGPHPLAPTLSRQGRGSAPSLRRKMNFISGVPHSVPIVSKPRDVNMQHGRPALVECGEAAVDRRRKFARLADALAVRAESLGKFRKIPPLALAARSQTRLKLVGFSGYALGVDALHRRLHRLPAAIVYDDREDGKPVLLRHGVDAVGRGEMKSPVTDHLHDAAIGLRKPEAQRHAARESKSSTG